MTCSVVQGTIFRSAALGAFILPALHGSCGMSLSSTAAFRTLDSSDRAAPAYVGERSRLFSHACTRRGGELQQRTSPSTG
jgi:hypothetical protein